MQLQRAMAAEAEASSEARAKVIAAEGEYKALKEAAMVITQSPAALQLRYFLVIHRTTSLRFLPVILFFMQQKLVECSLVIVA